MDLHASLQHVLAGQQILGDWFYEALLTRHPEIRPYFDGMDLRRQAVVLTMQLTIIECYHRLRSPAARLYLQYLGAQHHKRGIRHEHYGPFRDTMLEVLQQFHGEAWTPELAQAWQTAIDSAAAVMSEGHQKHLTV
jgi:hemoglobin-like flavoprotein